MKHKLLSDTLEVHVNFLGAEIESVKNKSGLEFIWQANKEVWPRHAPVLFPIVGKLKDNSFTYNSRVYELGQHGFARDYAFELIAGDHRYCTFQLRPDIKSKKNYPFDFIFQITHSLNGNKLVTTYTILNPFTEVLFFSVGAHPGFNCPLLPTESFENYYLEFESSSLQLSELNNGLRTPNRKELGLNKNRLYLSETLFDKDALVFENSQINKICLRSEKSSHKISLECINWPYFGIWSKKGCREFICLEPWQGIADRETASGDLARKDGIIQLQPKKEFTCSFSISFA